jgi:hypothetical protein
MLTRHCTGDDMGEMFDRLQDLENQPDLDWIGVRPLQELGSGIANTKRHAAAT